MRQWPILVLFLFSSSVYAEKFSLSQHKGKIVYLDFWASWCKPCRESFPILNKVHEKYKTDDIEIISVNLDENRKSADDFLTKVPAKFPVIYDPKGELAELYKIEGMPFSLLFDRKGAILEKHVGFDAAYASKLLATFARHSKNKGIEK